MNFRKLSLAVVGIFAALTIALTGSVSAHAESATVTITGRVAFPTMPDGAYPSFYADLGTADNAGFHSTYYGYSSPAGPNDGSFSFTAPTNLYGSNWTVQISQAHSAADSYIQGLRNFPTLYAGDGASPETANTFPVKTSNIDVGTIHPTSGTIAGKLTDASGKPFKVGWIAVYTPGDNDNFGTVVAAQQSESDGSYTVPDVPVGEYKVGFSTCNCLGVQYGQLVSPDNGDRLQWSDRENSFADADSVFVDNDQQTVTGVNAALQATPVSPAPFDHDYANYVALGDSYQSGEAAYNYYPGTDIGGQNLCHRSPDAYPALLVKAGYADSSGFSFWACSGATTESMRANATSTTGPPWDDPQWATSSSGGPTGGAVGSSQLDRLSRTTQLVTVGIGGNDMNFAGVLQSCILRGINPFAQLCSIKNSLKVNGDFDRLENESLWVNMFQDIQTRAPHARVLAVGYPHFFIEDPTVDDTYCAAAPVRRADQLWINSQITRIDRDIKNAARTVGIEYVDTYEDSHGTEECATGDKFFSGVDLHYTHSSFHPIQFGHRVIATQIEGMLDKPAPGAETLINQGQTIVMHRRVPTGTPVGHFGITWPGSTVQMTLTSPSGRVIDASTTSDDVTQTVTPTSERFDVKAPEPGLWTVSLYGAQIAAGGENVVLNTYNETAPNIPPTAAASFTQTEDTVQFSSAGSTDPDGSIAHYIWDFGDGTMSNSPNPSHTYTKPGTYTAALVVQDNAGEMAFAATKDIVIPDRLVYTSAQAGSLSSSIFTMLKDGSDVTEVLSSFGPLSDPRWSPDGAKIAYSSASDDGTRIYIANADGTNPTALTDAKAIDTQPAWSPDGTKIAFTSTLRSGLSHIYVINTDGTGLTAITSGLSSEQSPSWSPDGSKIAYAQSATLGQRHLVVANADGTNPTTITSGNTIDAQPQWSPDGTQLAYVSAALGATPHIWISTSTGTNPHQLTSGANADRDPAWSPDGLTVTFTRTVGTNADVYATSSTDGSAPHALTSQSGYDGQASWR